MEQKAKILILRWEGGQVPMGLMQLETLPGNSTNPASYPFPVKMVQVPGANTETIIIHPSKEVLQRMIDISLKAIEEDGIEAVTTSCGFNAIFQKELSEALPVPVFSSSLLQVPFVQTMVGPKRAVGVLTASKSSLSAEHLAYCGITPEMNVHVMGLEDAVEWSKIFDHPDDAFDMEAVTNEIINTAKAGVAAHPEIAALVLECTDLPPYAARLREELKMPVFDFNTMMGHVSQALHITHLY